MSGPAPIKLYARDAADMDVVSAYLQDGIARLGDVTYLKAERRFVMLVNRYCWEYDGAAMRVRAALQIGGVTAIRQKHLKLTRRDGVVSVLAIRFDETDPPSGAVRVILSGGGEIRLAVEACEAILEDITPPWAAGSRPHHDFEA